MGNKLIDCFLFFNELDLLEIRLNSLAPYVERFVLCESPVTHSGNPKLLYFEENKDRFKDFNITHLVVDNYKKYIGHSPLYMEGNQRDFLMKGLFDVDPETIVLLSDLDEIPDLRNYQEGAEGVFIQRLYYYFLNVYTGINDWKGTIAVRKKNITTLNELRNRIAPEHRREHLPKINRISKRGGGWHFSLLGSAEHIIYLIESFCTQRFNTPVFKNKIAENMENLVDPFNRRPEKFSIKMPSGPGWLLKNKDRYRHLFYKM